MIMSQGAIAPIPTRAAVVPVPVADGEIALQVVCNDPFGTAPPRRYLVAGHSFGIAFAIFCYSQEHDLPPSLIEYVTQAAPMGAH